MKEHLNAQLQFARQVKWQKEKGECRGIDPPPPTYRIMPCKMWCKDYFGYGTLCHVLLGYYRQAHLTHSFLGNSGVKFSVANLPLSKILQKNGLQLSGHVILQVNNQGGV